MDDLRQLPGLNIEQKDFLNRFYDRFNLPLGAPYHITNAEKFHYQGASGGSEFLVYNANKLYVCFSAFFSSGAAPNNVVGIVGIYDELNAVNMEMQTSDIVYDPGAANILFGKQNTHIKNIYFSRLVIAQYTYMVFDGYRITF